METTLIPEGVETKFTDEEIRNATVYFAKRRAIDKQRLSNLLELVAQDNFVHKENGEWFFLDGEELDQPK